MSATVDSKGRVRTSREQRRIILGEFERSGLDRSLPAPGLLAHILVSKYCDHLPLYRQEQIFQRHRVHLPRQTVAR